MEDTRILEQTELYTLYSDTYMPSMMDNYGPCWVTVNDRAIFWVKMSGCPNGVEFETYRTAAKAALLKHGDVESARWRGKVYHPADENYKEIAEGRVHHGAHPMWPQTPEATAERTKNLIFC